MRLTLAIALGSLYAVAAAGASPNEASGSHPQLYLGLGHTEPVTALAWSPDGKTLATGSSDDTVVLWDVAARRPRATLAGYTSRWVGMAWSPDGKIVAAADGHVLFLWDAATGRRRARLGGFSGALFDFVWSRDGRTIIGFDEHSAFVWDPKTRQRWRARQDNVLLWEAVSGKFKARLKISSDLSTSGMGLSPDGKTLATFGGYPEDQVILWDTATWRRRLALEGRRRDIGMLIWSPDSRTIAGIGNDEIALWNSADGRRRASLPVQARSYGYSSVAWSPCGKTLATANSAEGGGGYRIGLWSISGQRLAQIDAGLYSMATHLYWSPNGKALVSTGSEGGVVWDAATLTRRATLPIADGALAWSPDGTILATSGSRSEVTLRDGLTGQRRSSLTCRAVPVTRVSWSPDGRLIAVGTGSSPSPPALPAASARVVLWDTHSSRPSQTLTGLPGAIYDLSWRPDGRTIAVAAGDYGPIAGPDGIIPAPRMGWLTSAVLLWQPGSGRHRIDLRGAAAPLAWNPDGRTLATASPPGAVLIWNTSTGAHQETPRAGTSIWMVAWSPDGKRLATPSVSNSQVVYLIHDAATLEVQRTLMVPPTFASYLAWSPDGGIIATTSGDQFTIIWNAVTGEQQRLLTLSTPALSGPLGMHFGDSAPATLAWRPDGKVLATGIPRLGLIKLWQANTGQLVGILTSPVPGAFSMAWSPDDRTLACAYQDHTVLLWDPATRKRRAVLHGHTGAITALAWSPDGRTLATGSEDGSLRLRDAASGKERAAFYSVDGGKEWLITTPAGYFAASAHGAEVIQWRQGRKLWPAAKFRRQFQRPDLVRKALLGVRE